MKRIDKIQSRKWLRTLSIFVIVWVTFQVVSTSRAQSTGGWSEALNISNSGSADQPSAVVEPDGTVHILWQDEFVGILHSEGNQEGWSEPTELAFAMDNVTLQLVERLPESLSSRMIVLDSPTLHADQNGIVHAFWYTRDAELYHNQVPITDVAIRQRWSQARLMSESVVSFNYIEDVNGNLHLVFVSNAFEGDTSAGVYYRRWNARTRNWGETVPLFQSQYFRKLTRQTANVAISSVQIDGETSLYVVWDDIIRLRTYFNRSLDGGLNWESPGTLSSPENNIISPKNAQVIAHEEQVIVLWQEGDNAQLGCTQRFLLSEDQGRTWNGPINIFEDNPFCPEKIVPFYSPDAPPFFFVILQNRPYLVAWDGRSWGNLQTLTGMTGLFDPVTQQPIQLGCQSAVRSASEMLFIGCDQVSGDIWGRWRSFNDLSELFPAESAWDRATPIFSAEPGTLMNPILKVDSENAFHAFWIYHSSEAEESQSSIYYARLLEDRWSQPVELFQNVNSLIDQPMAIEVTSDGRFLLVWRNNQTEEIHFSWASTTRAYLKTEWAEPVQVADEAFSQSPRILVDHEGNMRVTYSVAINEARGVYMVVSDDSGRIWSQPEKIFDGVQAGWDIVGPSKLLKAENGAYGLLLTRFFAPFGLPQGGLYFGLGNVNYSGLESLFDESITGVKMDNGHLFAGLREAYHRLWLDKTDPENHKFWHEVSSDQGLSWMPPISIQLQGQMIEELDAVVNFSGQPQLLLISTTPMQTEWHLQHWRWDKNQWQRGENILATHRITHSVSAAYSEANQLGALYIEEDVFSNEGVQSVLWFTKGDMDASGSMGSPPEQNPQDETVSDVGTPAPPEAGAEDSATENPVAFDDGDSADGQFDVFGLDAAIAGPIIGGVIAVLVISIAVLSFRIKSNPQNKKYR